VRKPPLGSARKTRRASSLKAALRYFSALLFLIGLALAAQVVTAQGPSLTRGPYLQSTTRDSTLIVWQTSLAGDSVVEYGQTGYTQTVSDTTPVATHVITLTGLSAGTTYQYRIKTGETILYTTTLATAPNPGSAFDFVMIGDSGFTDPPNQAQLDVAAQMLALNPDFVLHLGDVIYPSGQASGYDPRFFMPYRDLLDQAPLFPSLGNHDYGTASGGPYLDVFYLPTNNPLGTERYYSFEWGNAHFVALDLNQAYGPGSAMYDWLVSDLSAVTAPWKFVFFHQAIYSSGPHGFELAIRAMRDALAPVFEQQGVDVVFAGHDHDYERSTPRDDYGPASRGVIYIVSGGGGADVYPVFPQPFSAFAASVHHTVQARIEGCILSLRAIDTSGIVFDQIALAKCPSNLYLPIILKGL